jgi:hypothetical protein
MISETAPVAQVIDGRLTQSDLRPLQEQGDFLRIISGHVMRPRLKIGERGVRLPAQQNGDDFNGC